MSGARRIVSLVKHNERFIFRFAPGQEPAVLESLVQIAADPRTAFDWLDAALVSYELGRTAADERKAHGARSRRSSETYRS
ncbi:MAG: hypothetical protein HRF50_03350 [Phycisphaerae bacterium]